MGPAVRQAVCTDSMSLCSIGVAGILLENVPCSFPPHQAPVSRLHMAPRGLLLPCTRHGLDCLFYKDSPSLFLLENTSQVANPSSSKSQTSLLHLLVMLMQRGGLLVPGTHRFTPRTGSNTAYSWLRFSASFKIEKN